MTPNGRRAWRRAAKKLRCKMGRRWRSQEEWVHGKRWSELVPDLAAHRGHICGPWFKRHGFQSLDQESSSRHYIGLWGTVDGDTIGFVEAARPFTARSLVGMTMGARKRAARNSVKRSGLKPYMLYEEYRIGERLRPCPGCANCDPYMGSYGSFYCGDPRNFTPDEECSTEEERELHRQHCEAWAKGERPTVKVSGIEWTEAINYTGRDGKPKTCPAGYAFVERAAYGLGSTRATNDKDGRFCDGSGVLPARKS